MREILTHQLSRRAVLKAGLALGLGLTARLSNTPEATEAHRSNVNAEAVKYLESPQSIEKAMFLAWTMAGALEKITPGAPLLKSMDPDVFDFRDEFVRYLSLIGFQKEEELVFPPMAEADFGKVYGTIGDFYIHGVSHCGTNYSGKKQNGAIEINERYFTPYSSLQRPDRNYRLVSTVAHELCHSNGVSCAPVTIFGDFDMVEGTTQIAATNALMAMSMQGSRIALPAALGLIERMAKGYVVVNLDKKNDLPAYEEFLSQFPNHSEEQGEWELIKSQDKTKAYIGAADDYAKRPLEVMADAMVAKDFKTKELPVPTKTLNLYPTYYVLANLSHFVDDYQHTALNKTLH